MTGPFKCFFQSLPELENLQDRIHFVFASTHQAHAFVFRDTLDVIDEIRTARKNGKTKIVFFNGSESFLPEIVYKVQRITQLIPEIPRKDLFFTVGCPNAQAYYDKLCVENGWENRLNVLGCYHFEFTIKDYLYHRRHELDVEYEVRPKEKLFVCFNKLHRKHRMELLAEAIRNGWLEKSYYSFEGAFPEWYIDRIDLPLALNKQDEETILSIKDRYPLRLNITEDRDNPVDVRAEDLIYHQNSYFSIVTETIMGPKDPKDYLLNYMPVLFLSEKIYKPIALKHPFIAFAWPGTLKALRERGYMTFHPYIDESYDEEQNYAKRFQMLIKEIKRLEQFTTEQWLEWQKNIKPLVEYNAKYLLSLNDHRDGPPVDHLFSN